MANKGDPNVDVPTNHQLVLIASDPHIDDLVVEKGKPEDSNDLLPAQVIQVPVKVAEEGDKVETKMAALIMVERGDLPANAQKIIKDEIQEMKASGGADAPVVPKPVTSENTFTLPPFDPYYYVGKLPNNFANSLTTNVSTNSLSMHKVAVDSTKLVDMLTMAKLSTQLSSINDSIHSFVVTSEASEHGDARFKGDTTSGLYSSSPCRSTDPAAQGSRRDSKTERGLDISSETPADYHVASVNLSEESILACGVVTVNNFVGEVENVQFTDRLTTSCEKTGDESNSDTGVAKESDNTYCNILKDVVLVDLEEEEVVVCDSLSQSESAICINNLPVEVMQRIFSYFTQCELVKTCALVCKYWRDMAYDPIYWQTLRFTSEVTMYSLEQVLARCCLLKSLELCGFNIIPEEIITTLGTSCPMLVSLDLSFCDAVNFDTTQLISSSLPQLEKFNVEGCQLVDGQCVHNISKLHNLSTLNLSHCSRVNSTSVCVLAKTIKKLQHLNIDGIPQVKDEAISTLVAHQGENLMSLHLDGAELTDMSLFYLLKCKNLTKLLVSFSELLTDKALLYIKEMTWLQDLQLRKGDNFTNEAIYWLFDCKSLRRLTHLNLSECTGVMDNSVIAIVECCGQSLRYLSLGWCYHIGDIGIESIVENCRKMEVLDLLGLDQVYGYSFSKIPQTMPHLIYLNLQQCHKVVDSLILTVVRQMPQLVALNYYGEEFRYGSLNAF